MINRAIVLTMVLTVGIRCSTAGQAGNRLGNNGPQVVILKLDDVTAYDVPGGPPVHPRWQRVADFLRKSDIKASFGIIGFSLEKDNRAYFDWIRSLHRSGLIEFWNHGYRNRKATDKLGEFEGSLAEQKAALERTQHLAKEKLGIELKAFGPHWSGTNADTTKALQSIPELTMWFYGPRDSGKFVFPRFLTLENPTHVPDFAKFKTAYDRVGRDKKCLALQGHPKSWDDERWEHFVRIIDYLRSKGCVFMTPSEYLRRVAADKPVKAFLLAGQSNMVGWGDSAKLPDRFRQGNARVLMFEGGKWQPLRPHEPANRGQRRVGLTEFHFGPEIAFAHEMAEARPDETIGIVKFAVGGTSILAWKPDWSKKDADRVGQGRLGSLYKKLMKKVAAAKKSRNIEIVGFLWLQGGGDTKKVDVAKEYLENLKSLVAAVRKDTGVADLPFVYGTARRGSIPDDLSRFKPPRLPPGRPGAWLVLKAQFDARKAIPHSKMVILRDIEKHPRNVHFNTAGQLTVGKLFAKAFLEVAGVRSAK